MPSAHDEIAMSESVAISVDFGWNRPWVDQWICTSVSSRVLIFEYRHVAQHQSARTLGKTCGDDYVKSPASLASKRVRLGRTPRCDVANSLSF